MEEVRKFRTPVVITKKGKPVAKLVPPDEPKRDVFGCMAGTATIGRLPSGPRRPGHRRHRARRGVAARHQRRQAPAEPARRDGVVIPFSG